MGTYDTAQICINGHVVTSMAVSSPELRRKFCVKCGERTIMKCEHCDSPIKGYYRVPGVIGFSNYSKPKFCDNCGGQYPWTKINLESANELIEFTESLNPEEKEDLKKSIEYLLKDSPKTQVAELKFKKYAVKAGKEISSGLKDILIDVVSETVKKSIWGN